MRSAELLLSCASALACQSTQRSAQRLKPSSAALGALSAEMQARLHDASAEKLPVRTMPCKPVPPSSAARSAPAAEGRGRAQLYEAGKRVKLNDVVEVYGVLSRVPELAQARLDAGAANGGPYAGDAQLEEEGEELAAWQPTSLVRCRHCLMAFCTIRKLSFAFLNSGGVRLLAACVTRIGTSSIHSCLPRHRRASWRGRPRHRAC